jgi:AcrR family transcriptional regulator
LATVPDSGPTADARPRSRNRRGEGALLRTDIQAAAADLLAETGNEQAVTLRAVARRIGISAPSIYRHFADRHAILLAIAADAFTELANQLGERTAAAEPDPVAMLRAGCRAYLDFAVTQPQLYKIMFGGLWSTSEGIQAESFTMAEVTALGQDALRVLIGSLAACVEAGASTSTDPAADAVALWLGLHGLAHQRTVAPAFPWPPDIVERIITALAHLG